ncbi:MAG: hypothetical protein ACOC0P_06850 [Planctomycetota bacterium]
MSNQSILDALDRLRENGLVLAMFRSGHMCVADGYDEHGNLILSARGETRRDALMGLISRVRYQRPELLRAG